MSDNEKHGWTHAICDHCWTGINGNEKPIRVLSLEVVNCCYCSHPTRSGIYNRADAKLLPHCPDNKKEIPQIVWGNNEPVKEEELTPEQWTSLRRVHARHDLPDTFRIHLGIGGDYIMVEINHMTLGIEKDGHTHS